ncbi:MAG: GGDEF domain-containing protein [Planctomycetales bacterium]
MPDPQWLVSVLAALALGALLGWSLGRRRLKAERAANQQAIQNALREARTDPLTGVGNRAAFEEGLAALCEDFRRDQFPCALLLLDIDGLKAINDRLGHAAGDEALARLARELRAQCRGTDLVARLGGDEFAVLLPRTDEAGGMTLAARIQERLRADSAASAAHLQVSLGCAALRAEDSAADLQARADAALYRAKQAGGGRAAS